MRANGEMDEFLRMQLTAIEIRMQVGLIELTQRIDALEAALRTVHECMAATLIILKQEFGDGD